MANTITGLIVDLYAALDVVSREMVGIIPAATLDAQVERAALNQPVKVPKTRAATATDITPGVTPPDDGDQTLDYTSITISKSRRVPFRWNGEQSQTLNNGPGRLSIQQQQIAQAMRTLINEVEADLAGLYNTFSRAYGAAGTTPFATADDLSDFAETRRILEDNGAPTGDLRMVLGSAAKAKILGKQSGLFKANEAGSDALLRTGAIGNVEGFMVGSSAAIKTHTKGTGTSYLINNASNYAAGSTTLALDTGSGTVIAGDVVTIAGDTNKYVVGTALSGGSLAIAAPGLRASAADNAALTVGNNYTANLAFSQSAIILATRAPALPEEGDMAIDRTFITDPITGLTFEVSKYLQYRQVQYEIALAWGFANVKPEHTAILLG